MLTTRGLRTFLLPFLTLLTWGLMTAAGAVANPTDATSTLISRAGDELVVPETPEVPTGDPYLYFINSELGSSGTVDRISIDDVSIWEELVQIPEYQNIVHGISVDVDRDRVFYTTGHGSPNESSVWEASLKGENPLQLYRKEKGPDPDPGAGFGSIEALGGDQGDLVWLDVWARRIWLGNAAGANPTYYEFEGREWLYIGNLYGLAVDMHNQVALVSDWEYSRIYQVTPAGDISLWMDQSTNESLVHPAAMAIDNVNGWLYWLQHNGLWRTPLDSRLDDEHLYEFHDSTLMGGLALELQSEMAYWAGSSFREIRYARMDGTSEAPERFVQLPTLHYPHGIAIAYIPEPAAGIGALAALLCVGVLRTRRQKIT